MNWVKRGTARKPQYERDGWVVRKPWGCLSWFAFFRGDPTPAPGAFSSSTEAMKWVDADPAAQRFAASVLRKELDK